MKKILLALLLMTSMFVKAQKDTSLTDSTALLTIKDYNEFWQAVGQELPAKYADLIRTWFVDRINQRINEFEAKYKKPKK